jgi:uncharacterized protein
VHVLTVVTPEVVARGAAALVDTVLALDARALGLLPVRPGEHGGPHLPTAQHVAFTLAVHDELGRRDVRLPLREVQAVRALLAGRPAGFCELQGGCHGSVFSVEPDGTLAHCDKFVDHPGAVVGHLRDEPWPFSHARHRSPALAALRTLAPVRFSRVAPCRWSHLCRGWCPHEHHVAERAGTPLEGCCGLAPLFERFDGEAAP